MKSRPRIRRTIKWGGVMVAALLVVVWMGSGWYDVHLVRFGTWSIGIRRGQIEFTHVPGMWLPLSGPTISRVRRLVRVQEDVFENQPSPFQLDYRVSFRRDRLWSSNSSNGAWATRFRHPLWVPAAIVATLSGCAWILHARGRGRAVRLNLCPKCGYDRSGIAGDAKCPECGASRGVSSGP